MMSKRTKVEQEERGDMYSLTELIWRGTRQLIAQVLKAEVVVLSGMTRRERFRGASGR